MRGGFFSRARRRARPGGALSLAGVALLLALGCATGPTPRGEGASAGRGSPTGAASPFVGRLTRRVDPFPVSAEDGTAYALPFLGGFNVPRPQWVDLDGDGDLDLVIQEYTGRLIVFENEPRNGEPRWVHRPDRLADVDVGEWYRFVDVDADGDPDLLGEQPFSYIRLFENRGAGAHPLDLVPAVDTLRDVMGQPIFSDRQNIPNAVDLDCDGRLDLLLGRTIGTISHFEATRPMAAGELPRFELVSDRFHDIQIVGVGGPQLPGAPGGTPPGGAVPGGTPPGGTPGSPRPGGALPGGTRHGANTMALADHDRDGDLDLFWGDFFEPGLLLLENTGTCESPAVSNEPRAFPLAQPMRTSGYNAPAFGDVDGDGDLDLLVGVLGGAFNSNTTTVANLLFFEREGGDYTLRTTRYLTQLDVGSESVPALVDLDGDGDLDLLVANKIDPEDLATSRIHRFENTGAPGRPSFRLAGTLDVPGAYHNAPAFGDLDGDGDPDMLLGTWRDELRFFRNEGTAGDARFVLEDSAFVKLTRGSNAMPTLGDLDGDGDLDLLVGESSGTINFYRNVGTASAPAFELVSDAYGGIEVERRSAPALLDVDLDGDLDLLVGTERQGVRLWRNDGGPTDPAFTEADPVLDARDVPAYSVPVAGDLDGDGDMDLFVGGLSGGLFYFERTVGP